MSKTLELLQLSRACLTGKFPVETNMEHLQVLRRLLGSRGENLNQSVTVL